MELANLQAGLTLGFKKYGCRNRLNIEKLFRHLTA
jgi:hypothetical protein